MSVALLIGCSTAPKAAETPFVPLRSTVIAVAPAINASGSEDFDPIKLGDLMASELGQLDGVDVIGVSRVLAALNPPASRAWEGGASVTQIRSPAEATRVADKLGADGILVFAITEYDPYDPPTVGISAQLYGCSSEEAMSPGQEGGGEGAVPRAELQRVFRVSRSDLQKEVEEYGKKRDGRESAYGWRRYLVSQEDYFRFCCHAVLKELLRSAYDVYLVAAEGPKDEERMP
jgi:hypothetical protein